MFTLRSTPTPRALYKSPDSLSGLDQTLWPLNVIPTTHSLDNETKLNELEKKKQLRVLSPLFSYIATSGNSQYHAIASLVAQKTEKIIERALGTFVLVKDKHISILAILADSANPRGHWSVEGHQAVNGLKKFAQEELTLTRLQSL